MCKVTFVCGVGWFDQIQRYPGSNGPNFADSYPFRAAEGAEVCICSCFCALQFADVVTVFLSCSERILFAEMGRFRTSRSSSVIKQDLQ